MFVIRKIVVPVATLFLGLSGMFMVTVTATADTQSYHRLRGRLAHPVPVTFIEEIDAAAGIRFPVAAVLGHRRQRTAHSG